MQLLKESSHLNMLLQKERKKERRFVIKNSNEKAKSKNAGSKEAVAQGPLGLPTPWQNSRNSGSNTKKQASNKSRSCRVSTRGTFILRLAKSFTTWQSLGYICLWYFLNQGCRARGAKARKDEPLVSWHRQLVDWKQIDRRVASFLDFCPHIYIQRLLRVGGRGAVGGGGAGGGVGRELIVSEVWGS